MDTTGIVAICVSVLGTALIIAVAFLLYKWLQIKLYNKRLIAGDDGRETKTQRMVVHRGRVIPARQSWTPSFRSGWTSMRRRSWMLASNMAIPSMPSFNKNFGRVSADLESLRGPDMKGPRVSSVLAGSQESLGFPLPPNQLNPRKQASTSEIALSSGYTNAARMSVIDSDSSSIASPRPPPPAKSKRSVSKQQRQTRQSSYQTPSRSSSHPRPESQHFPRPPFLSPIESRLNNPSSPLTQYFTGQTSYMKSATPSLKSKTTPSIRSASSPPPPASSRPRLNDLPLGWRSRK